MFNSPIICKDPYKLGASDLPWKIEKLREFELWIKEFTALHYSAPFFFQNLVVTGKCLRPGALKNYKHMVMVEFSHLLPDDPNVKAILPVLLTGYILSRRGDPRHKDGKCHELRDDGEKDNRSTANSLINLLMYQDRKSYSDFKRTSPKLFRPAGKYTKLPKLQYLEMNEARLRQSLFPFKTSILFLFLAYKTSDVCNLTLSCSLFIEFSKCGILGDPDFPNYADLPDERKSELSIENDPLRDEILNYIKWALNAMSKEGEEMVEGGYTVLDRFLLSLISEIIDRAKCEECEEAKTCEKQGKREQRETCERQLTVNHLQKNKWAYRNIYNPYAEFCFLDARPLPISDDAPDSIEREILWEALDEWNSRKIHYHLPPHKRLR